MKFIDSLPYAKELLIDNDGYDKEEQDKCNKKYCKDCEFFIYTSSVIEPDKLHIRCNKTNQFSVVDLEHTVKPEDFYEEEK
jgi:hypothetical protein